MFLLTLLRGRSRAGSTAEDRLARLRRVINKMNHSGASQSPALNELEASDPPEPTEVARPQPLRFPLGSARRIAVLCDGFALPSTARAFRSSELSLVAAWKPDALVVPLNLALLLAGEKLFGDLKLPSVEVAVAVVTRIDDAPLGDDHRELLWRAFQVPIFEMLASWDGCVIARECEVHHGLHVDRDVAVPTLRDEELLLTHLNDSTAPVVLARTGFSAELEHGHCDCGEDSPRLHRLTALRQRVTA